LDPRDEGTSAAAFVREKGRELRLLVTVLVFVFASQPVET